MTKSQHARLHRWVDAINRACVEVTGNPHHDLPHPELGFAHLVLDARYGLMGCVSDDEFLFAKKVRAANEPGVYQQVIAELVKAGFLRRSSPSGSVATMSGGLPSLGRRG